MKPTVSFDGRNVPSEEGALRTGGSAGKNGAALAEELQELWEAVTFDLADVLYMAAFEKADGTFEEKLASQLLDTAATDDGHCLRVEQQDTLSGRCFVLLTSCPLENRKSLLLVPNLVELPGSRLPLHFHHARASLGLNENLWSRAGRSATAHGGSNSLFGLSKTIRLGTDTF